MATFTTQEVKAHNENTKAGISNTIICGSILLKIIFTIYNHYLKLDRG